MPSTVHEHHLISIHEGGALRYAPYACCLGGKVWRIGLMGYNSQPENVERVLTALGKVMQEI